jgi:hypothetical protein
MDTIVSEEAATFVFRVKMYGVLYGDVARKVVT